MKCLRTALLVIFLICAVPRQSDGYFLENLRKLAQGDRNFKATKDQMSPSPSPVPAANLDPGNTTCDKVSNKCDIKDYSFTACVRSVGNGSQALYVLVINAGDNSLGLNMTIQPSNNTQKDIELSGNQVEKVYLPPQTVQNYSISLNVGNRNCVILIGASIPQGFYPGYLTPFNGMYLLFGAALLIGGTWACCILAKRRRHLDGVPYQELEMEQQESNTNPSFVTESPEGWDQNWDDDWDEEKAVRSPGGDHNGKVSQNGGSLKYIDTTQWGNDWDD